MQRQKRKPAVSSPRKERQGAPVARNSGSHTKSGAPAKRSFAVFQASPKWNALLIFLLLYVFSTFVYGDVFRRAAESNFITSDAEQMKFLTDLPGGWLYWASRWLLLSFKSVWLGGLLLSALLTVCALGINRMFGGIVHRYGLGFILPYGLTMWMMWRGVNLFYKCEPSLFLLYSAIAAAVTGVAWAVWRVAFRRHAVVPVRHNVLRAAVFPVCCFLLMALTSRTVCDNTVRTARMQMNVMEGDWEALVADGLSAPRPSRAVAAYYAVGLVQTGRLLDNLFDIPYNYAPQRATLSDGVSFALGFSQVKKFLNDHFDTSFDVPELPYDIIGGGGEYGVFLADCNYYAGLLNAGYRSAMDQMVMSGPSLYYLKRMAVCAIANGERALAEKYLHVIGCVPFEQAFVDRYAPLAADFEKAKADEEIASVLKRYPEERLFEQNYRQPAFLGYNTGLMQGTDETLATSIAACLYSKEVASALQRISIYARKDRRVLSPLLQQAICVGATKVPEANEVFKDVIRANRPMLLAFVTAAKPLIEERDAAMAGKPEAEKEEIREIYNNKMREQLGKDWRGTYYYYYYCENNSRKQIKAAEQHGVN